MKEGLYMVIVGIPAILTAYGPFILLLMMGYQLKRLKRWVATYAFYRIIQKKSDDLGEHRWLFKDMDLTDEKKILSKVLSSLFLLFLVMFGSVVLLFYYLLLLDVTFKCDPGDNKQDCFKYMLFNLETFKNFSREAVDCNSAAAKNGTVAVMCYKIVFNFGLAAGASYGSFQITMVFLNVASAAMLMIKRAKTICKIRVFLIGLFLALVAAFNVVVIAQVPINSDNLVFSFQGMVSVLTGFLFMFGIPWKKLIALKVVESQPTRARRLRAVPPFQATSEEQGRRAEQENQKEKEVQKKQRSRKEKRSREEVLQNPDVDVV